MIVTRDGHFERLDSRLVVTTQNIFSDICNNHNCKITWRDNNTKFEIEGEEEDVNAASDEIEKFARYNTQMIHAINAGGCLMLPLTLLSRLF